MTPEHVTPFLMFQDGRAEEALRFYVDVFDGAEILQLDHFAAGEPGAEGTVKQARIRIAATELRLLDSPAQHAFGFTPSVSLYVTCGDADELERAFGRLADGGEQLMPLGDYGFSERFGWVNDRYGVSWQLDLPRAG